MGYRVVFMLGVAAYEEAVYDQGSVLSKGSVTTQFSDLLDFHNLLMGFVIFNEVVSNLKIFWPDELERAILVCIDEMS